MERVKPVGTMTVVGRARHRRLISAGGPLRALPPPAAEQGVKPGSRRRLARGHSMIEVLVAALVMATGVLGASALQAAGLRSNRIALQRSDAVQAAWSIIDRIRVNATGDYDISLGDAPPTFSDCIVRTCTADDLATFDVVVWKCSLGGWVETDACVAARGAGALPAADMQPGLPAGDGSIDHNGAAMTVTVRWQPDDGDPLTLSVSSRA